MPMMMLTETEKLLYLLLQFIYLFLDGLWLKQDSTTSGLQAQVIVVCKPPPTYLPQPLVRINGHTPTDFTLLSLSGAVATGQVFRYLPDHLFCQLSERPRPSSQYDKSA